MQNNFSLWFYGTLNKTFLLLISSIHVVLSRVLPQSESCFIWFSCQNDVKLFLNNQFSFTTVSHLVRRKTDKLDMTLYVLYLSYVSNILVLRDEKQPPQLKRRRGRFKNLNGNDKTLCGVNNRFILSFFRIRPTSF